MITTNDKVITSWADLDDEVKLNLFSSMAKSSARLAISKVHKAAGPHDFDCPELDDAIDAVNALADLVNIAAATMADGKERLGSDYTTYGEAIEYLADRLCEYRKLDNAYAENPTGETRYELERRRRALGMYTGGVAMLAFIDKVASEEQIEEDAHRVADSR